MAGIVYPLPSGTLVSTSSASFTKILLTLCFEGFYDLGNKQTSGDVFLLTFQYFLGLSVSERPSVISISYGSLESDSTSAQANSMCNAAQQLAAAGMTIVVGALLCSEFEGGVYDISRAESGED